MTNLQLTVMIAAYCGHKETDHFKPSDTYSEQVGILLDAGMIIPNFSYAPNEYKFKIRYWPLYPQKGPALI